MQTSVLQKETMPDSSWKLIGIPISLWQLERHHGSHASPREVSLLPCQASKRMLRCPLQLNLSPHAIEPTGILKGYPRLNLGIYPGSRFNSRKTMRLHHFREMRPVSLHCGQNNSVFTIKHERSLDFLDGTPESPRTLSQF